MLKRKIVLRQKINVVLTGGHAATTGLAVVQEIIHRKKNWNLFWIGSPNAFGGKKVSSFESRIFKKYSVTFVGIVAGKISKKINLESLFWFLKIPFGFLHALVILVRIKPKVVMSFGGYSALPVVYVGKLFGAKIVIHEQVIGAGWANRVSSKVADAVVVARKQSSRYFSGQKIRVVGNPLTREIMGVSPKTRISKIPLILVMGGSRGAQAVNDLVTRSIDKILERYRVVHLTGVLDYSKISLFKGYLDRKKKGKI